LSESGPLGREPTAAEDAAPLQLRGAAPHAVVDPVLEGVLATRILQRALRADLEGDLHARGASARTRVNTERWWWGSLWRSSSAPPAPWCRPTRRGRSGARRRARDKDPSPGTSRGS